ncbi:Bgt-20577 [Blumeria graminis f. sp. tritici]|uniref:Bgt-20577 n=2 Tax=Blumeria graminis f. sp. tritici TaxID=62690 RepID=A0A9X9MN28_BLUGR|nr:Bgt-20577 [Blumeria graminis f. sp. tritici]
MITKICSFYVRNNHIRDRCFKWIDTAEGSRWAAKNPQKAEMFVSLERRLRSGRFNSKD